MQARYEIHTFQDLLNVLRAEPTWLEELRKLILTTNLLELPQRFEEFVQKDFKELKDRVEGIEHEMIGLKEEVKEVKNKVERIDERLTKVETDVAGLKTDVAELKTDVAGLKTDVAGLKGDNFERKVRENAPSYLGKLIKKCRVIDKTSLASQLDDALDTGMITEEERDEALSVDLVAEGYLRTDSQKRVLVVAEVSVKADKVDVERAYRRSKIVEKALGIPTIPVVIGQRYTAGAKNKAKELQIYLV